MRLSEKQLEMTVSMTSLQYLVPFHLKSPATSTQIASWLQGPTPVTRLLLFRPRRLLPSPFRPTMLGVLGSVHFTGTMASTRHPALQITRGLAFQSCLSDKMQGKKNPASQSHEGHEVYLEAKIALAKREIDRVYRARNISRFMRVPFSLKSTVRT